MRKIPPNGIFAVVTLLLLSSTIDFFENHEVKNPSLKREINGGPDSEFFGFTEGGIDPIPITLGEQILCWIEFPSNSIYCTSHSEIIEANNSKSSLDNVEFALPDRVRKPISIIIGILSLKCETRSERLEIRSEKLDARN
mgnify:CR=1 FL=1